MNDISNTFILNSFEPPKKCVHTIGLILYPYEGYAPIKDGEQEPITPIYDERHTEKITLFNFCPDCGKKLTIIEQFRNNRKVLADVES